MLSTAIEWISLLHIQVVLGSDLGPETDYPDRGS
jgi:hypothetical protein